MKTWMLVAVSAVVGVLFGVGATALKIHSAPWDGTAEGARKLVQTPAPPEPVDVDPNAPKVKVDNETFNFDTMDSQGTGSHEFVFTNAGRSELTLTKGETTCKCTKFELGKEKLQPGESAKVRVDWAGKNFRGKYRQHALVKTNDPLKSTVTLVIEGQVTSGTKTVPSELVVNDVVAGKPWTGTVQVFCFVPDKFEITGWNWGDATSEKLFEARIEPIPATQLKEEKDAKAGYVAHLIIKPGLPLGAFNQTIRMKTTLRTTPEIELPIHGKVNSEITVAGPGWDDDNSVLTLGEVNRQEGAERTLMVFASGEHRHNVKLEKAKIQPEDLLDVEIGKAQELGSRMMTPVTIRIPKGSRPANHMGTEQGKSGVILLKTNHPQAPELRMRVRFAVLG